jgi:hypothetical protein
MSMFGALRRISLAMLVSVALAMAALSPVQATPRVATAPQDTPFVIPPPGDAPPAELSDSEVPAGVFTAADGVTTAEVLEPTPPKIGPSADLDLAGIDVDELELIEASEFSNVYETPEGMNVAEIAPSAINAEVDGEWVPM